MGLGLLGGALNDAKFLLDCGANLTITDLKSEKELAPSIKKLAKYKKIKYVLGRHDLEDFVTADFILQPGNVPLDSPYLAEARKNKIPIYESESLFMEQARNVKVIGVTGTRGKSTTAYLIYEILKSVFGPKVHLAGNVKGSSTLVLLKKIKTGDIIVLELDSWCLHGFGEINLPDGKVGKSPNISVFTNLQVDHQNYYKGDMNAYFADKANIYKFQKPEDFIICGEEVAEKIGKTIGTKIITGKNVVSKNWKLNIKGEHNLNNIAYAVKVAEVLNVPMAKIKKAVENFGGVEGRMELAREYKGIKIYNDTNATTPDATLAFNRSFYTNLVGTGSRQQKYFSAINRNLFGEP